MKKYDWKREVVLIGVLALLSLALFAIPSPKALAHQSGTPVRAEVLTTDDSLLQKHGLLLFGTQQLEVKILEGEQSGKVYPAANELLAQMELDKVFAPGDTAVVILQKNDRPGEAVLRAQDFWRSGWTLLLFGGFCLLLCWFGGWVGLKALLSFVFSCVLIWKAVIPLALRGWPASWTIFGSVVLLTAVIIYLVAGFNRKGTAALAGAGLGIFAGLAMAHCFTALMKINGAGLPYAQTLLYSGYDYLNLQDIFVGAMILASSGAVMDLSMDIAAGVEEVSRHNPELSARELCASGMRIGRSVVGTMTTTLLLAYSGGYITLLMAFAAQGNSPWNFINNPLVASEAVKTLIGSFSLVLVAPFTALAAGFFFRPRKKIALNGAE